MNKSLYKILVGIFFIAAGVYGYIVKEGMLQVIAIVIGAYGAYNIGWGMYLRKKENGLEEQDDSYSS